MQRVREVLLTQYIGAIVIGMLITHAFVTVIGLLVQPLFLYAEAKASGSIMPSFSASQLLSPGITAALYVLVSYGLIRWLYSSADESAEASNSEEPEDMKE